MCWGYILAPLGHITPASTIYSWLLSGCFKAEIGLSVWDDLDVFTLLFFSFISIFLIIGLWYNLISAPGYFLAFFHSSCNLDHALLGCQDKARYHSVFNNTHEYGDTTSCLLFFSVIILYIVSQSISKHNIRNLIFQT